MLNKKIMLVNVNGMWSQVQMNCTYYSLNNNFFYQLHCFSETGIFKKEKVWFLKQFSIMLLSKCTSVSVGKKNETILCDLTTVCNFIFIALICMCQLLAVRCLYFNVPDIYFHIFLANGQLTLIKSNCDCPL